MNANKIHPDLLREIQKPRAEAAVVLPIIVQHKDAKRVAVFQDGISRITKSFQYVNMTAHTASVQAIEELSDRGDIIMVYLDKRMYAFLDIAVPLVGAPVAWQSGFTGKGIRVGIVDTGVDHHPDLESRIIGRKDFTGTGPYDENGHGTHVAGIVGGSGSKYRGIAPECLFVAAKVLDRNGSGYESDVMAGLEWVFGQGAKVANLSLGSSGSSDGKDPSSILCNTLVAKGMAIIVAAGNEGPQPYTIGSPAAAEKVITVGASSDFDHIPDFSSRGPTADGRIKPDICAPGVEIMSCRLGGGYISLSGTSMAAPIVAGACALILQFAPELAPLDIKQCLMVTAKGLGEAVTVQGAGRIQINKVIELEPEPPTPVPNPGDGCLLWLKSALVRTKQ